MVVNDKGRLTRAEMDRLLTAREREEQELLAQGERQEARANALVTARSIQETLSQGLPQNLLDTGTFREQALSAVEGVLVWLQRNPSAAVEEVRQKENQLKQLFAQAMENMPL